MQLPTQREHGPRAGPALNGHHFSCTCSTGPRTLGSSTPWGRPGESLRYGRSRIQRCRSVAPQHSGVTTPEDTTRLCTQHQSRVCGRTPGHG